MLGWPAVAALAAVLFAEPSAGVLAAAAVVLLLGSLVRSQKHAAHHQVVPLGRAVALLHLPCFRDGGVDEERKRSCWRNFDFERPRGKETGLSVLAPVNLCP